MSSETKLLAGVLIISLVLIIGAVFILGRGGSSSTNSQGSPVEIDYSKGQKIGSDSAKVKLAEFSDLQCPACKAAEPFVLRVRNKYKENFQFIYFHFPLMQHPHAKKAANFAEYAATQNKFWEVHDKLFETQDSWSPLPDPSDYFADLGSQFGLDKAKIKEAISKETFSQKVNDNLAEGNKAGVDATPSFYINGKRLKLQSYSDLDTAIARELH